VEIKEIRDRARQLAKGSCRVCPVCDGRVCSGEVPGMGGAGSGVSFRNNVEALAALRFNTRLVHEVRDPNLATEILGLKFAAPIMIGPIGGISFNLNDAMPEKDYQEAVVAGAEEAGLVAGLPDAVPLAVLEAALDIARRHPNRGVPFIKPWEPADFEAKVEMCARAGCRVVGCDLDSIGLITLRKMGHPAYAKNRRDLAGLSDAVHRHGLKFIIKGLMVVEDAVACLEAGVDAIVVSNHGGRVLDSVPGTAEVLPALAAAVRGRMAVMVDGGVRSGVDVLKMLALGADCVMVGRPFSIAAVGGGREGVALYARTYASQLSQAMIMTGCADVREAGLHLLYDY
jgi:isopentenyl diphosphate isomerase/L-lactate dehydrogenase-like FMN-dependent dehydrogenase